MKNSIAIWADKKDDDNVDIDIDLNLWLSRYKNSFFKSLVRRTGIFFKQKWFYENHVDNYIEFGIKISDYKKVDQIHIYFPYNISHHDIKDIVPELTNITTLNALFNEKMNISQEDGGFYLISSKRGTEKKSFVASASYFEKEDIKQIEGEGCLLTLKIPHSVNDVNVIYKRIRIKKLEKFVAEFSSNNFFIEGLFKKLQTVEININSLRRLPKYVIDSMNGNHKIKSVNFFMMTDIFMNLIFHSQDIKSSRILEEDTWNKYLGIDKSFKGLKKVVAYQWKSEKDIEDYNLFVKLEKTEKRWMLFFLSILFIIFFGIISGYGGNKLTTYLDSKIADTKEQNSTVEIEGGKVHEADTKH